MATPTHAKTRTLLVAAFAALVALFSFADIATLHRVNAVREQTKTLVRTMMTSVGLIAKMNRDIKRERLLLDAHIFEKDVVAMTEIEARLAAVEADHATLMREYDSLGKVPGDAATWQMVKDKTAALEAPVHEMLFLSRQNRDAEARAALLALKPRFDEVEQAGAALIQFDRASADRTAANVEGLQRSSLRLIEVLTVSGIVLSSGVGVVVTRLVQRREVLLERYAAALQTSNQDLDAFAGRVSHDLRGPLHRVALAASAISAHGIPEDGKAAAVLRRGIAQMELLIQDLLELARLQSDGPQGFCNPAMAAAQVRDDIVQRTQREDVDIRLDLESANVECGEGLLRQALWNLVENAVKYHSPGTRAEVEMRGRTLERDTYELSVRDNGVGMELEDARRAFDPFFRAKRACAQPGTGLGLAIVKRIVESRGGTVSVASQVGKGTTVTIRLRLAKDAPIARHGAPVVPSV